MTAPQSFLETVSALTGGLLDGDLLWQDVAKMGPDASAVHVNGALGRPRRRRPVQKSLLGNDPDTRKKRINQLGAGLGVISLGVAGKEIGVGAKEGVHAVRAATAGNRVRAAVKPGLKIGGGLALAAGDVIGTHAANEAGKTTTPRLPRKQPVDKGLKEQIAGALARNRRVVGATAPKEFLSSQLHGPERTQRAIETGQQARKAVDSVPGTVKRGVGELKTAASYRKQGVGVAASYVGSAGKKTAAGAGAVALGADGQRQRRKVKAANASVYDSYGYAKADTSPADEVTWAGTFSKLDDEKRIAFGWASVVEKDGMPVVDRQGDYIGIDDIEEAAYTYVQNSRVGGDMHRRAEDGSPHKTGELVESVVFTKQKCEAMGLPDKFAGTWWIGMKIHDDEAWGEVKKGKRAGFSIHGRGLRKDVAYDSLMGS